ncbi:MAG: 2-oxoglutarate dehydrogenase complex dihydrolipoyllysine-residue succinyltransferase [Gammaproteobacteria bacterium]|nr:MAG: 2-oxoglutarate dehydrogenase complex dihydrolipoyllysine-residue succinyltransferase [Gammaproteobacteria bacterium]
MLIELKVPVFPESVTDGTILCWNRKPGDVVKRDEPLVDIETDKVVFEVPAPKDGVLEAILEDEGAVVASGQLIGRMREETVAASPGEAQTVEAGVTQAQAEAPFATPAARRLIEEHGLDVRSIQGSGSGKRILKEDILAVLGQAPDTGAAAPVAQASPAEDAAAPRQVVRSPEPAVPDSERLEQRVPMTRLRARIAERLLEAQHNAAILTTFNEVNMQPVMDLRARYREAFEKRYGVRLGFMSFFVKAAIEGLRRFPELNASIDGTDIVYHGFFDIGIAVSSPRGLVVPILRDADRMAMADIEIQVGDYADKAREGSLSLEDITGGTFTITNGGVFGSLLSTPILNPPQSGIFGMHKIQQRPVAEHGEVVIRPMMNLALSYDHRLVDGREAVQFLVTVKEIIEDPARLMLGV